MCSANASIIDNDDNFRQMSDRIRWLSDDIWKDIVGGVGNTSLYIRSRWSTDDSTLFWGILIKMQCVLISRQHSWDHIWWILLFPACTCRLKMEDEARVDSVSMSERRHCRGPWWGAHCGLPPDPQWGQTDREGITGGEVSWIKPAAGINQTCRVQRSAPLRGRRTRILRSPRKSTSRWARQQSHASGQRLLSKSPQEQHKHPFTACRKDWEEAENQLKNVLPQPRHGREERHRSAASPRWADDQVGHRRLAFSVKMGIRRLNLSSTISFFHCCCVSGWSRSWGGWRASCRWAGRASRSCEATSAT